MFKQVFIKSNEIHSIQWQKDLEYSHSLLKKNNRHSIGSSSRNHDNKHITRALNNTEFLMPLPLLLQPLLYSMFCPQANFHQFSVTDGEIMRRFSINKKIHLVKGNLVSSIKTICGCLKSWFPVGTHSVMLKHTPLILEVP